MAAYTAASELLANFPMLQVEIYHAKEKEPDAGEGTWKSVIDST